jgi:probable F420-dependent oxidoreductase
VDAPSVAAAAELDGVAAVWSSETTSDPFLPLVGAGNLTSTVRLGTAVAVAFARSPFVTAQAAWELTRASGGRFVLGLGTQVKGHVERRFSGTWTRPIPRMEEYVAVLRAIFRAFQEGGEPAFSGEYYRCTLLPPAFRPAPVEHPDIPIWVAGATPAMARLAGRCADGLIAHPLHSRSYLGELLVPAVSAGAQGAQRSSTNLRILVPVWIATGRDDSEFRRAADAIRAQIAFYGSTRTYRRVFEHHGWTGTPDRLHRLLAAGQISAMSAEITAEMLRTFAVVCEDPADVPAELERRLGGLATGCMPWTPVPRACASPGASAVAEALRG